MLECRREDQPCLTTVPELWGLFQITHNDFEVQGHPEVTLGGLNELLLLLHLAAATEGPKRVACLSPSSSLPSQSFTLAQPNTKEKNLVDGVSLLSTGVTEARGKFSLFREADF